MKNYISFIPFVFDVKKKWYLLNRDFKGLIIKLELSSSILSYGRWQRIYKQTLIWAKASYSEISDKDKVMLRIQ